MKYYIQLGSFKDKKIFYMNENGWSSTLNKNQLKLFDSIEDANDYGNAIINQDFKDELVLKTITIEPIKIKKKAPNK